MRQHSLSTGLTATLLTGLATAQAPPPSALVDLETTAIAIGSEPTFGAVLPGIGCVFAADHPTLGRELWLLPTSGGAPQVLKDIHTGTRGSHPDDFAVFQGEIWFSASDGVAGRELWKTDGTAAGTVLAVDVTVGGAGSAPSGLTACGSELFFTAFADGAGREPHRTGGTAATTLLLADLRPGVSSSLPSFDDAHLFTCCNGKVMFYADDGVFGDELYVSDGTPGGTQLVLDINPGSSSGVDSSRAPVCCNGELFFRGRTNAVGNELFASDGTAANTRLVADIHPGSTSSSPQQLRCLGNQVFFSASEPTNGRELYVSDGTTAGTTLAVDIRPGTGSSGPHDIVVCGAKLIFGANGDNASDEPWVSDGTPAGTQRLADLNPGSLSSLLRETVCCGTNVFFRARSTATGEELFVTDGTAAGTGLVSDLLPGTDGSRPVGMFCCGTQIACSANGPQGQELVLSDGTAGGTIVHDLMPIVGNAGSSPKSIRPIDGAAFYFIAETAAHGEEVFFFDGQTATAIETVPGPDDGNLDDLTIVGRTAYWTASANGIGTELYRSSDGGAAELVADIRPGSLSSSPSELTAFDHKKLVCVATTAGLGREVIVAENGVPGVQTFDVKPGASPSLAANLNRIIDPNTGANFVVFKADDGVHGSELFVYDGITVELLADLETGSSGSGPQKFTKALDETSLVFAAFVNGSTKVMRLTVDSTTDVFPGFDLLFDTNGSFFVQAAANIDGFGIVLKLVLMMDAFFNNVGEEPYAVDALGQAHLIDDINEGEGDAEITVEEMHFIDGKWVTVATTADIGEEIHTMDNLLAEAEDLLEGSESSSPSDFVQIGHRVVFSASGIVIEERTVYLLDQNGVTPLFDGNLVEPQTVGTTVVGGLWSPAHGNELVQFPSPGAANTVVGVPCDGRSRLFTTPARTGQTVQLRQIGGDSGELGAIVLGNPLGQAVPAFGCWLHIDPTGSVVPVTGTAPGFEGSFVVPNNTSLVGIHYATQGVWLEPGGTFTLTNAVYSGIGQ